MNQPIVAYFSAEYAIADDMPIYAGGLGVLAADVVLEAALQNLAFYAIGLVYHHAFTGDDPDQRPMVERLQGNGFELATDHKGDRLRVKVQVADRTVWLQAWTKGWGKTRMLLLDSHVEGNDQRDQEISDRLYPSDPDLALAQSLCLGFGGVAILEALAIKPDVYHLNEGHTAMAGLALVLSNMSAHPGTSFDDARARVRKHLVGTKHTILAGAGLLLNWDQTARQLHDLFEPYNVAFDDLKGIAQTNRGDYSDTRLLIELTRVASGVSKIHTESERRDHDFSKLIPITNGVFKWRWVAANWHGNPLSYSQEKLWAVHSENRQQLLEHVRAQTGTVLDPERLTIVWARRMAAYKRPELLVSDLDRLRALAHHSSRPVQFIVSGQANPADTVGRGLMQQIIDTAMRTDLKESFAYLPHYNPTSAKLLVRGADVWLNTPIRGFEACGTSGMKASLNGAVQCSTRDGWVDEVDIESIGWALPNENVGQAIYDTIENDIAPLFYDRADGVPAEWLKLMLANMKLTSEQFTAKRMLGDYYSLLYRPTS